MNKTSARIAVFGTINGLDELMDKESVTKRDFPQIVEYIAGQLSDDVFNQIDYVKIDSSKFTVTTQPRFKVTER